MSDGKTKTVRLRLAKNWTHIVRMDNGQALRIVPVTENGRMCIDIYDVDTSAKIQKIEPSAPESAVAKAVEKLIINGGRGNEG